MDVIFVPALTGLGAPYWQPSARGTIFGLTRATSIADLARATLEGVAFQVADLIEAMNHDLGYPLTDLRVDGGMARSDPFLQFQADLLGLPIHRSPHTESTALGAALLAGLGAGLWPDLASAIELTKAGGQSFTPGRDDDWRKQAHARWQPRGRDGDQALLLIREAPPSHRGWSLEEPSRFQKTPPSRASSANLFIKLSHLSNCLADESAPRWAKDAETANKMSRS